LVNKRSVRVRHGRNGGGTGHRTVQPCVEHHVLPLYRQVPHCLLPAGQVLGLSKFARIVDMLSHGAFANSRKTWTRTDRRAVEAVTNAKGVRRWIEASAHMLHEMRASLKKQNSKIEGPR